MDLRVITLDLQCSGILTCGTARCPARACSPWCLHHRNRPSCSTVATQRQVYQLLHQLSHSVSSTYSTVLILTHHLSRYQGADFCCKILTILTAMVAPVSYLVPN